MVGLVRTIARSLPLTAAVVLAGMVAAVAVSMLVFGLSLGGALAFYFVVWWIMLFAVLPFGVRSQLEQGDVVQGSEPGAPAAPMLVEKTIWTTIVAGFVFLVAVSLFPLAGL